MNRGRALVLFLIALTALLARCPGCERPLRTATYNIRRFGVEDTDLARLTVIVARADADVVAVQEIERGGALSDLAARLSQGRRRYRVALAECGGRSNMKVGFLYDAARVDLVATKEYPELAPDGGGACSTGDRAALAGTFRGLSGTQRTFHLLAVHFVAGSDVDAVARRRTQWKLAHVVAAKLSAADGNGVAILGDTNSTGYLDDARGERTFIDEEARRAEMDVETNALGCSEYWEPEAGGALAASLLDHVVATRGLVRASSVEVHSFCRDLRCRSAKERPSDYVRVTDHCPVTFDISDR